MSALESRAALDHAERVEDLLVARIVACEDAGRAVPERIVTKLDDVRARIEWLARRIEQANDG